MKIDVKDQANLTVVEASGDLDILTAEQLRARVIPLVKEGRRLFLLDLSKVNYMDSSGLGVVLRLWELCQSAGGYLALCGVGVRIRRVFQVTQVDTMVPLFATRREATTYLLLRKTLPPSENKRVLVYSTNEATLIEMLRIISAMGHTEIHSTRDLAGARQVLQHTTLDLVVLDLWSRLTNLQRLFLNLAGPNRNVPVVVTGLGGAGPEETAPSRYEVRRFKTLVTSALEGHEISFIDVLSARLRLAGGSSPTHGSPSRKS